MQAGISRRGSKDHTVQHNKHTTADLCIFNQSHQAWVVTEDFRIASALTVVFKNYTNYSICDIFPNLSFYQVSVWCKQGIFGRKVLLGEVRVALASLDLSVKQVAWYKLFIEHQLSDGDWHDQLVPVQVYVLIFQHMNMYQPFPYDTVDSFRSVNKENFLLIIMTIPIPSSSSSSSSSSSFHHHYHYHHNYNTMTITQCFVCVSSSPDVVT